MSEGRAWVSDANFGELRRRLVGMTIVPLEGALDIGRYPNFHDALSRVLEMRRPVVLDLTRATRFDSTFLTELLLVVRRRTDAGFATIIALADPALVRVVSLARLLERLTIVPTVIAATHLLETTSLEA